jgi:hypothetical protein
LEHANVALCETFDQTTQAARDGTKSGMVRNVPIPPPLLLQAMHDQAGGEGLVCRGIASQRAMARGLRTWLRKAGVTRPSLFKATSVSLPLRWHDLRATCGTWLAVAGRPATEIRDVLGHTQVSMTDRYMRDASAVRGGQFGEPFPALPVIRQRFVSDDIPMRKLSEQHEFLRGGRDSNASSESASAPTKQAESEIETAEGRCETSRARDGSQADSRRLATNDAKPIGESSDAELERAIVGAVTAGAFDVAKVLSGQLEDRRRARAQNVVDLAAARRRGR